MDGVVLAEVDRRDAIDMIDQDGRADDAESTATIHAALMSAARLLQPHLQHLTPFISVAVLMGFAIVHGIRRYGWKHFVVFFIVAFVISWSYEIT